MITDSLLKSMSILLCSLTFSTPLFSQASIYVDADAPNGGNGNSWASAYNSLQTALANSSSGDEIWVAEGAYQITGNEDTSFEIPDGVALYGGFDATETTLAQRDWINHLTELDGANSSNTVVYFENSSPSTILDGFTIKDGDADGINQRGQAGAGIYMDIVGGGTQCSPRILNCTIKDHNSDQSGGAVYIDGSFSGVAAPYFENCTFDNNFSLSDGGAIYGNGIWGGAVNATYLGCTFSNNHSVGSGGAIFNHGGNGNVTSIFKKCDFDSNLAEGNGGALYSLGTSGGKANHEIINSRFYANQGFAAGAIYNNGGNTNGDASPNIINCTFHLNEATGSGGTGGAIYNNGSNGGQSNTQIINCIIWGNIGPFGSHALRNIESSPTISYSLVDVEDCAALNSGAGSAVICGAGMLFEGGNDPAFEDATNGNLRIANHSDGKNTGDDNSNAELDDLDGNNRFEGVIDMGAYENSAAPLPVELLSFTARPTENQIILEWTTLSEQDNQAFIVERSEDGRQFEIIAQVNGAGNSNQLLNYQAFDHKPVLGLNYYRLKTLSYSGEIEYSQVQIVEFKGEDQMNIFPNPVRDLLTINNSTTWKGNSTYRIVSMLGKVLLHGDLQADGNQARINLSGHSLAPGHYFIEIQQANKQGIIYQRFQKIN